MNSFTRSTATNSRSVSDRVLQRAEIEPARDKTYDRVRPMRKR